MPRKAILSCLVLIDILLLGCFASRLAASKPTPTPTASVDFFFKAYLNMPQAPSGITDFSGTSADLFPVFLSSGFYQYNVDETYFDQITAYDNFFSDDSANSKIQETACTELPQQITSWPGIEIDVENKICYTGTFIPYIHYLILDPDTRTVYHFYWGVLG
jgi:hypothetical protein